MEEKVIKTSNYDNVLNRAISSEKNQKFNLASAHYYTLLTQFKDSIPSNIINEIKISLLFNSFLIQSSSLKDNFLNYLITTENIEDIDSKFNSIIKKVTEKRIITKEDESNFYNESNKNIPSNIKDLINSDNTLLEKAIFEHNIYSLSLLYENIDFNLLSVFLDIKDTENIKSMVFKLIIEGKIKGKIDEEKNYIFFNKNTGLKNETDYYNSQIRNFCTKVLHFNDYYD